MNDEKACGISLIIYVQSLGKRLGQWHTFYVDLVCFEKEDTDTAKVVPPFLLSTDAMLEISLTDIAIVPNTAKQAITICH